MERRRGEGDVVVVVVRGRQRRRREEEVERGGGREHLEAVGDSSGGGQGHREEARGEAKGGESGRDGRKEAGVHSGDVRVATHPRTLSLSRSLLPALRLRGRGFWRLTAGVLGCNAMQPFEFRVGFFVVSEHPSF